MAANIPTLQQIEAGVISDLQAQYGITIPFFGKVFLRVLSIVQAGKLKLLYLVLGFIQRNIFVDTADSESVGGTLERFGRVKINRNPFGAVAGQYNVTITGSIGAIILAQTTFKSDDTSTSPGFMFVLDNDYTMVTTSDVITLRGLTAGLESSLNIGDTLTATSPIALIDSTATVSTVVVTPLAAEDIEDYRRKIVQSYQLEPQGGATTDYRLWANDAQGVKTVYPYAKSGVSSAIDIFVEATVADSTDGKGTPTPTILANVGNVIEFNPNPLLLPYEAGRRPIKAKLFIQAITPLNIDVTITGLMNSTPSIVTKINAAIDVLISNIRPYVDASDVYFNRVDTLDINTLIATIVGASPGVVFTSVTFKVGGVTYSTYQFTLGFIPYNNSITYV